MKNQSIRMNLNMDGRERKKVKVDGSLRGQGLCMQKTKRMWHRKMDLMQLDRDMGQTNNNNIDVRELVE